MWKICVVRLYQRMIMKHKKMKADKDAVTISIKVGK